MTNVINFTDFKVAKEIKKQNDLVKITATKKLIKPEPNRLQYDYNFLEVVELFVAEHIEGYTWKFDIWLSENFKMVEHDDRK